MNNNIEPIYVVVRDGHAVIAFCTEHDAIQWIGSGDRTVYHIDIVFISAQSEHIINSVIDTK